MSLRDLLDRQSFQLICENLHGRERRILSMLSKEFLAQVFLLEQQKKKVDIVVSILVNLDVENNLETIYRLAVTHNSQTILLVEGENLSQVISFCNKYTVGKIILAFQCPERSNLSDLFAQWMPILMGTIIGKVKDTTFIGGLPNVPVIINFKYCSRHINHQLNKLLPLLLAFGARDVVLQKIPLSEAAKISSFTGETLIIECSDKHYSMPPSTCLLVKQFLVPLLKCTEYKEITLVLELSDYDDKIGPFVFGWLEYITGRTSLNEEHGMVLILPQHRVTFIYDVIGSQLFVTVKTEAVDIEEEMPDIEEQPFNVDL